jgi:hypothetical protein
MLGEMGGIVPFRAFRFTFKSFIEGAFASAAGIVPVNKLTATIHFIKLLE